MRIAIRTPKKGVLPRFTEKILEITKNIEEVKQNLSDFSVVQRFSGSDLPQNYNALYKVGSVPNFRKDL